MTTLSLDRKALYYPYIHVDDVNWLKATLLCFGRVHRMVPDGFRPRDHAAVSEYLHLTDENGKNLLSREYLDTRNPGSEVSRSQARLLGIIKQNRADLKRLYSQEAVHQSGLVIDHREMIHIEKVSGALFQTLMSCGLAWHPAEAPYNEPTNRWLVMHPQVGDAVMSTIAISVARQKGMDIVTHNGNTHHAIATLNEAEVFSQLVNLPGDRIVETSAQEKADELAQVVIASSFDLTQLSAAQVSELIKERADLRAFKDALLPFASRLPDIIDPEERRKGLEKAAEEVREQWERTRSVWVRLGLSAMVEAQEMKAPEWGR